MPVSYTHLDVYKRQECGSLTAKGAYRDVDLVLAKPQSYMNTSGGPVKQLMNAYGVDAEHLIVCLLYTSRCV